MPTKWTIPSNQATFPITDFSEFPFPPLPFPSFEVSGSVGGGPADFWMAAERQHRLVSDIGHADRLSQRADHPAVRRMLLTGDLDAVSP